MHDCLSAAAILLASRVLHYVGAEHHVDLIRFGIDYRAAINVILGAELASAER